jgi:16S rRNA processing protein RimM
LSESGSDDVIVGRVIGVFGLRGDVKVEVAAFDLTPGLGLVVEGPTFDARRLTIAQVREGPGHLRVRFEGIEDATSAEKLRGAQVRAPRADLPALPVDAYLEKDLIGMEVVDAKLGALGKVSAIASYPGSDMLVVGPKSLLVPMLKAYGMRIDPETRTITTTLPPGFEELS